MNSLKENPTEIESRGGRKINEKIIIVCVAAFIMYQKYFFISIIFFLTLTIIKGIIAIEQGQNLEKLTKKQKRLK